MIIRNGKLITTIQRNLQNIDNKIYDSNHNILRDINQNILNYKKQVTDKIGAIYKGTKLVWITVYDAIRSCFGSGTWLSDRPWLQDDTWKNN